MYSKGRQTQTSLKKQNTETTTGDLYHYSIQPTKLLLHVLQIDLKVMLPKMIHEDQKGFMKGRYSGENIRLLYVLQHAETKQLPGLLYWSILRKRSIVYRGLLLKKLQTFLNFGPDIKLWVKAFYGSTSTCVLVNGHYSSWFNIGRGVR